MKLVWKKLNSKEQVLSEAKMGKVDFRNDDDALVKGILGKVDFSNEQLLKNLA